MHNALDTLDMDGRILIGKEGRLHKHSTLDTGRRAGTGHGPETDVLVDPIDGRNLLARGNTARFPVNGSVDLHGEFDFGKTALYLNVANVTNRYNPIVNTADGFIYDAGILPSVGLRHRF